MNSMMYQQQHCTPITPPGTTLEQWMARGASDNFNGNYSPSHPSIDRAAISRAVYDLLVTNLPPSLEYTTSKQELAHIADAIESKLYQSAPSPQAYCALSTLEFRITALATAVLIHSDMDHRDYDDGSRRISEDCARLSAAARKSLIYCVMVLVSYEKQKLKTNGEGRKNVGIASPSPQYQKQVLENDQRAAAEYYLSQIGNVGEDRTRYHPQAGKKRKASGEGYLETNKVQKMMNSDESKQHQPFPPSA